MVSQFGSACFGTRTPEIERGPCGKLLPGDASYPADPHQRMGPASMPSDRWWPGTDAGVAP